MLIISIDSSILVLKLDLLVDELTNLDEETYPERIWENKNYPCSWEVDGFVFLGNFTIYVLRQTWIRRRWVFHFHGYINYTTTLTFILVPWFSNYTQARPQREGHASLLFWNFFFDIVKLVWILKYFRTKIYS